MITFADSRLSSCLRMCSSITKSWCHRWLHPFRRLTSIPYCHTKASFQNQCSLIRGANFPPMRLHTWLLERKPKLAHRVHEASIGFGCWEKGTLTTFGPLMPLQPLLEWLPMETTKKKLTSPHFLPCPLLWRVSDKLAEGVLFPMRHHSSCLSYL